MKSISHTKTFELMSPIYKIFPLFTPEGEKLWAPGWDYENLMGTMELAEDYVFLTKTHDHRTKDAIWIVKDYDPRSHFVQYYKIEPEDKVGVVAVKCSELGADTTMVQVTYKYIALSQTGEDFISGFDESAFSEFIDHWELLLTDYLGSKS